MTTTTQIAGIEVREVTQAQFFAAVGPMNVHPRPEPDRSVWETPQRRVVGVTTPGYMCVGTKAYFLAA